MSNLESRPSRRGLWLMLSAWVVVLGLVGAAVGFVMLERVDTAGEAQVATTEASEDAAEPAESAAGEQAEGSEPEGSVQLEGSVQVETGEAAEPETAETEPVETSVETASSEPEPAVAEEPAPEPSEPAQETAETTAQSTDETTNDTAEPDDDERAAPAAAQEAEAPQDQVAEAEAPAPETTAPETPAPEASAAAETATAPEPVDPEQQETAAAPAEDPDAPTADDQDNAATQEAAAPVDAGTDAVSGDEGAPPWQRYAGQAKDNGGGPKIAVVLTGLGLSAAATEAAIKQLPSAVTLSFSPYARRLNQWIALARVNGHEVMIDLPMEPVTFPEDDPGPHALLTFLDSKQNLRRLDWVLNRGNSYVGVAAVMGSRFAASEEDMGPVMSALMERGLMFLDNRSSDRSVAGEIAVRLGLPHAVNDRTLDAAQASRIAINSRLTEIERLAEEKGFSIAMAQPYPVTLERLRDWAVEIEARGYALVPITALAAKKAGG